MDVGRFVGDSPLAPKHSHLYTDGSSRSVSSAMQIFKPSFFIFSQRARLILALLVLHSTVFIYAQEIFRDRVTPNWIEGGPRFWYRIKTAPGEHRFILVDPDKKTRRPAFDHDLVGRLLNSSPGKLPILSIDLSETGILNLSTPKGSFRLEVESEKLIEIEPITQPNGTTVIQLKEPRKAQFNGSETHITFRNETSHPIELFWVNNVESPRSYGTLAAGENRKQHTFSGHVWLARKTGSRESLAVFEATSSGGIAVVDGSSSIQPAPPGKPADKRDWSAHIRKHNVLIKNGLTGESRQLTTAGTEQNPFHPPFHWSPDGQKLIVLQTERAKKRQVTIVESSPADQLQPRVHSFPYTKPGDKIDHPRPRLFDLKKDLEVAIDDTLFATPWALKNFHWSKNSDRVFFTYNQRGHQIFRLIGIDAKSGATKTVIEEAPDTFVCYSSKTFCHPLPGTDEVIWMSERDGWNHLYLFDAGTGALKNQITSGDWVVRKVDHVDPETRQVWFQSGGINPGEDPYHLHFCRVDFDGRNLIDLTPGDGSHSIIKSPDGNYLIDRYSRVDQPPVTELRNVSDGSLIVTLEEAKISEPLALPERFTAMGRDGKTPIYGLIHRPKNFDPEKRYPVIEQIYAGPHGAHVPKTFSMRQHPYTEHGFVVVRIDGMGTSHRSKEFHDVAWKNLGDAGFPDRIAWMKAAAESRPWMDLERVGIYGGSAGGQNAMRALIAHHEFYKVAAADCGCHDNRMDKIWWNEQWMGWPIPEGGGHYSESSNVDQAHRVKGDLMLIVGELDRNVDPASTMQVAAALQKADIDFDLLVIPGAGHGAAGTPYARRKQRDFFIKHLGSDSRPK